jgi:hypothetical protein
MKTFAMIGVMVMVLGAFAGMVNAMGPMDGINPKADYDKDGLTNAQEYTWGTDPNDPDSDGDGCYDGWEIWYETHRAVDKNQNTIIDSKYHFDANFAGDAGLVANTNPDNLAQVRDGDANVLINDPDGDGWNNLHEFLAGTDPTNPNTDGDSYAQDSSDPDPLVSNDIGETGGGNGGNGHTGNGGNGGGGSGIGEVVNII